ncbi:Pectinesterase domain-containing protein/PMEI domain-containing protein [Cephalotus follicularis]|uniref:Pectinesterase n=1 Tax=Cephalotus follicularis TaxID=3775 RepID=A0A1Q3CF11_CEPFO|nr:Pectinesterase domain-containing protein/PMEI domain-containing protein [Cephalotus follicularis]
MERQIYFLITLLFLPHLLFQTTHSYDLDQVKSWCNKTPYPRPCEYFLSNSPSHAHIKDKSHFLTISTQLALDQAMSAKSNMYLLESQCRNELEKAAWTDCLHLYQQTIQKLNQTMNPNTKCTQYDTQTWLSTALTNLDTCQTGFVELGVHDYFLPLISNDVSMLISNTLALNKAPYKQTGYKHGFPTWVKPRDRKLLLSPSPASQANVVVAQDGSGNYKTIGDAINAAPKSGPYVIYVKTGTYKENLDIKQNFITILGDGIGNTKITGSKSVGGGSTTFKSATVAADGDGFIARGISFINTAGVQKHQAVALRSSSDKSVFYSCSFEGYQDTLYAYSDRQFYKECYIYGTVDFIFGNAAVVFQDCNIYARKPLDNENTITAQGRTDPNQNTGISIQNCVVAAASDLEPVQSSIKTYLGRPWKAYSRTVFMETNLGSLIDPAGWVEWNGNFALNTLYYGEYKNTGAGSSTSGRVNWEGYHVINSSTVASAFTVGNFIDGNSWLPATNVPFQSGL